MNISGILVAVIVSAVALLASGAEALLNLQALAGPETVLSCRTEPGVAQSHYIVTSRVISNSLGVDQGNPDTYLLAAVEGSARERETSRGADGRYAGVDDREAGDDHRMHSNDRDVISTGEYAKRRGYDDNLNQGGDRNDASAYRINKDKYYMDRDSYYMDRL